MKKDADGSLLTKGQLKKLLLQVPLWTINPKNIAITRTFLFKNHINALVFIARTTVHAQVMNHHPEILFTFNKVKISLSTHDVKGLTRKDLNLALKIDLLKSSG